MIFSGGRINPAFYNGQLADKYHLLPATFGPPRGDAEQDANYFTLQDRDLTHGIVALWNDPNAGTLSSARFYRAHDLLVVTSTTPAAGPEAGVLSEAGAPQVVVKFSHGAPAIVERTFGLGRVVMFASTADSGWNDLPVRPSFVPLMHRVLGALVERQDEGLNVRVGQRFVRRVASELLDKEARVFKPRQTDALLEQRRIELVNGWPMLQFEGTDLGGIYEVGIGETRGVLRFAAQPEANESSLDELSSEQKKLLSAAANVMDWTPGLALRDQAQFARGGAEFWLPIVILALLIAGAETFLAHWFSRPK